MELTLRQETAADHKAVHQLIEAAFRDEAYSDQQEHFLVARLRKSAAFVPELSIVAESNGKIVGHILLTKIKIKNETASFDSLALAPVSVHPNYQHQSIGGQLIREAHQRAKELGFKSIVLLGHAQYYPRFGYQQASQYGISLPFPAPDENVMVIELVEGALQGVSGEVVYDGAFFE